MTGGIQLNQESSIISQKCKTILQIDRVTALITLLDRQVGKIEHPVAKMENISRK